MKTEQKDQPVTANQSGQQNQRSQSQQDIERIKGYPTSKPTTRIEDDEEQTDVTKREEQGTDHPHDSKTPVVEQNRQEQNQGRSLVEENATRNTNQSPSGNMVDEKRS